MQIFLQKEYLSIEMSNSRSTISANASHVIMETGGLHANNIEITTQDPRST